MHRICHLPRRPTHTKEHPGTDASVTPPSGDGIPRPSRQALSISVTTLKRLCRRHGVKRWPHRQLSGLNRAVSHLEAKREAAKEGASDPVISDQLNQLYSRRDIVIDVSATRGAPRGPSDGGGKGGGKGRRGASGSGSRWAYAVTGFRSYPFPPRSALGACRDGASGSWHLPLVPSIRRTN